jgi:hypothetical protein
MMKFSLSGDQASKDRKRIVEYSLIFYVVGFAGYGLHAKNI